MERLGHERAAAWFRDHGEPGLAIDHLLEAGHHDEAFDLLTRHLRAYLAAGRHETVRGWLDRLPAAFVDSNPGHQLMVAFAYARSGRTTDGERIVERARAAATPAEVAEVGIHFDVTESLFAAVSGDPERAVALGDAAWARRDEVHLAAMEPSLAAPARELWGYLPVGLARAHALLDDRAGVRRWARVARRQGPPLPGDLVGILGAEAWVEARHGRLRAAAELGEEALALGTEQGRGSRRAMIGARTALALVHRERDELDRAVEVLEPYIDNALVEGHVGIATMGEAELARVACSQGRTEAALRRLVRVRHDRATRGMPAVRGHRAGPGRVPGPVADRRPRPGPGPDRRHPSRPRAVPARGAPGPDRGLPGHGARPAGGGRRGRQPAAPVRVGRAGGAAAAADGDLAGARRVLGEVAALAQREEAWRSFLDEGFDIRDLVAAPAGTPARPGRRRRWPWSTR